MADPGKITKTPTASPKKRGPNTVNMMRELFRERRFHLEDMDKDEMRYAFPAVIALGCVMITTARWLYRS